MKSVFLSLILYPVSALFAQTVIAPIDWRVETTRPAAVDIVIMRGETITLQPRFESRTTPMQIPTNSVVRLVYRSPNMAANTYHQVAGNVLPADPGRISVTWTPQADNGASVYDYSLIAENPTGTALVRSYGKLLMRGNVYGDYGTPATLTNVWSHVVDSDNPHQVTAGQVGAYTEAEVDTLLENVEPVWGNITGTLTDQGDLSSVLDTKVETVQTTGGPLYPHFLAISDTVYYRNATGTVTTNTVTDSVTHNWVLSYGLTDRQINLTLIRNPDEATVTYSSSNPAVATVSATGLAEYVSPGTAEISAHLDDFTATKALAFSTGNSIAITNIVAGVSPWLRHAATSSIDSALVADAGALDHNLFDTLNWSTHSYVRNASSWAYAATGGTAPWTGLAVWETGKINTDANGSQGIQGTLISPNVIAFCAHNQHAIGTEFKWLGSDGVIYTRALTAKARIGLGDGMVGKLDSALPAEVTPLKILPFSWTQRFSFSGSRGLQIPAIAPGRNLVASVSDTVFIFEGGFYPYGGGQFSYSHIPLRQPYFRNMTHGDSGSPVVWAIGNQLVLISVWHTPFGGAHFVESSLLTGAVNLIGGTQPSVINLSSYPNILPSP